ncbi:MAG: ankyrin repeat domain-containing protein [Pyrinomonadaceae bacterium]|nr:ankyrin repeat domain-containing protein [Pyrinomonadaceae bacterium]
MSKSPSLLDRVRIASPCSADWDSMTGNDEVRFCQHCNLHVHNLSGITRQRAEELVVKSQGRLCVRYRQTTHKKVLTATPLSKQRRTKERASRLAASAFTAALSVSNAALQTPAQNLRPQPNSVSLSVKAQETQPNQMAGSASLVGTAFDPNGAVIPGAKITLSNTGTSSVQTTASSDEGAYRFESLEGGDYTLKVQSPGFKDFTLERISLQDVEQRRVDATLEVGALIGEVVGISPVQQWIYHYDEREEKPDADEQVQSFIEAVESEETSEVKGMLRRGIKANVRNEYGETALMLGMHNERIVKILLRAGADANARSDFGVTPLMYAMLGDDVSVVKLLLAAGADANAQDKDGRTALMFATFDGRLDKIKALLRAGANINARDHEGKTAMTYAREGKQTEAEKLLRAAGAFE